MPIRDIRMMAKGIQQRWPMSPEVRKAVIGKLIQVLADPTASPREITAAAKALMAAEAQNQADERTLIESEDNRRQRLLELARQLPVGEIARIASDHGFTVAGDDRGDREG